MEQQDLIEFIRLVKKDSKKIIKMLSAIKTAEPGTDGYTSAVKYIKKLSENMVQISEYLNNALN